ncbi:thioredoxin family protein [Heyndrickxia sporothermodurans]|uniref:thioredoxin family protein n=1 Tax=Heyndrickxia sporothermodurans TaxID=46224 RepID=UPI0015E7451F|nr:thioredoxin family protein [Heyndrickxia sporothermodurans]
MKFIHLKNQEELTVYFYQTSCSHCKKVTPIVIPMAQKLKIDLKLINLENYSETGWDEFNIDATPTIVHFKNGREDKRIVGELTEKAYELWFKSIKE